MTWSIQVVLVVSHKFSQAVACCWTKSVGREGERERERESITVRIFLARGRGGWGGGDIK